MTTYPIIAATGDSSALPIAGTNLINDYKEHIWYTSPDLRSRFYLSGALAPWPGIQDGIHLKDGLQGLSPDFKHIDLKSARQPGVTWTGTLFDTMNPAMSLQANANTPQGIGKVISEWKGAWHPAKPGTLEYWTIDRGYWYNQVRLAKRDGTNWKQTPRTILQADLAHYMRFDLPYWLGMPSIDSFAVGGGATGGSGYLNLANIGEEDGWPVFLFYGPGTFTFGNGTGAQAPLITLGPLLTGQIVLLSTLPRLNNLVDLTSGIPQALSVEQQTIQAIINFVTNNNVPPILQQFESKFGILPPQGSLWTLLSGRYDQPIPGVAQPDFAQLQAIPVSISGTGGSSVSKIVGRIDPMRLWPE